MSAAFLANDILADHCRVAEPKFRLTGNIAVHAQVPREYLSIRTCQEKVNYRAARAHIQQLLVCLPGGGGVEGGFRLNNYLSKITFSTSSFRSLRCFALSFNKI
jgi:hypothetical protein